MIDEVLQFWFIDHGPKQWWKKDPDFDRRCRSRFLELHAAAAAGELVDWRDKPTGRLAEVIILDQFSRNMFRDDAKAFAYDGMALVLAQEAVRAGADRELPGERRKFFYMPYMHSESRRVHEQALRLFTELGDEDSLDYERRHKAIVDRFGRYPHRNRVLGRASTPEETEFLSRPGSSF